MHRNMAVNELIPLFCQVSLLQKAHDALSGLFLYIYKNNYDAVVGCINVEKLLK